MAKFEEISPEIEEIFYEVRNNTTLPLWVEFKVLCNNKQNTVCKIVKANDLIQTLTKFDFIVTINEDVFDRLPDDMQKIAIDECLAGAHVNDNDGISLNKEDFNTHTGVLQKYGDEKIIQLHESIKSLYEEQKLREAEEKEAEKARKKQKK